MPENQNTERTEKFACFGLLNSVQALEFKEFILSQRGVITAGVNFAVQIAFVRFDTEKTRVEMIIDNAKKFGVSLVLENENTLDLINRRREDEEQIVKYELIFSAVLTLPILILMFLRWFDIDFPALNFFHKPIVQLILAAPVVLWLGLKQIIIAIKSPLSFAPLAVFGSFGAFFLSIYYAIFEQNAYMLYFDTAVLILIAVHSAKLLNIQTKRKISIEIGRTLKDKPKTATVIRDSDKEELISIEQVREDDILTVRSGEQIAADGIIISGTSSINERIITGSGIPVDKFVGDKVYASTTNLTSPIIVSVTATGDETEFAQIIRKVEKTQSTKKPRPMRAEIFTQYFVIAVFVLVFVVCAVNIILGKSVADIILTGSQVFVIACACALGLAVFSAIMNATAAGIKQGIIFRGGVVLETLMKIKVLAFGKNETLTSGKLSVSKLLPLASVDLKDLYDILLSLSSVSKHPIAKTINEYALERGGNLFPCNNHELSGGNIKAKIGDSVYSVGTYEYSENLGEKIALQKPICYQCKSNGELPNILIKDGEAIAVIVLSETIRNTASKAVSDLSKEGIQIYMLTQDDKSHAARIANLAGISQDRIAAELNPEDKADTVMTIMENEAAFAMVGSGMNDAIAMSNAPIAISMGITNSLIDMSDIAIENGDLSSICRAIEISRKTVQITNQNLVLACIFNLIGVPFALIGILDPAIVSLAAVISCICVVANSYRIESK